MKMRRDLVDLGGTVIMTAPSRLSVRDPSSKTRIWMGPALKVSPELPKTMLTFVMLLLPCGIVT
jgi:hypothetical protein